MFSMALSKAFIKAVCRSGGGTVCIDDVATNDDVGEDGRDDIIIIGGLWSGGEPLL